MTTQVRWTGLVLLTAGAITAHPPTLATQAESAHAVSADASRVAPARLLAYFTCDRRAPLTKPAPGTPTGGK